MAMGTRKIGPAVAAGCTMVVKPAELTPLSMLALAADPDRGRAARRASSTSSPPAKADDARSADRRPAAAQDVVHRLDAGRQALIAAVRRTAAAGARWSSAATRRSSSSTDADLDAAVEGAMVAKMRNIGEACIAANRFHVARVGRRRVRRRAGRDGCGALKVGRGTEDGVEVGPLIDAKQRDKVAELVDDAVGQGCRGVSPAARPPTARATSTSRPCSPTSRRTPAAQRGDLRPGGADRDVRRRGRGDRAANDTEFGLVAYVFTRDLKRALRVSRGARVRHGRPQPRPGLQPAAPFGGVKQSGFGREGGYEGIEEYVDDEVRRGRPVGQTPESRAHRNGQHRSRSAPPDLRGASQ